MCPPVASPVSDIGLYYGDKEICMFLEGISNGTPLPSNVISDVNPYQYLPSALPGGIWYFIGSKEKKDGGFGYWRTKGEESQIFSNSSITGWRSTLEFFEGQAPHGKKTNWVTQEYWITRKILPSSVYEKEFSLLCNVFCIDEQKPNHEKPQNMTAQADVTSGQPIQSVSPKAESDPGKGSTSKSQMGEEVNVTRSNVSVTEIIPPDNTDIVPEDENDYFHEGDFLELRDLETPPSPSSCSDSSCFTMSSGECFDALDLLRDLDPEKPNDVSQIGSGSGSKLRVFEYSRPNEVVVHPASTGTLQNLPSEEEVPELDRKISDNNKAKSPSKSQEPNSGNNGKPSTSQNQVVSDEDGKEARGRKKKLKKKYLCFIPF